jgi:phytoene/squalene synthetase
MSIVERFYAPITERPSPNAAIDVSEDKNNAIALRRRAAASSFFWAMQLLPVQRRQAMRALYAFCHEVDDIADGEASRSLRQALLSNWRSEIAHLFAGRPRHAVTPSSERSRTSLWSAV